MGKKRTDTDTKEAQQRATTNLLRQQVFYCPKYKKYNTNNKMQTSRLVIPVHFGGYRIQLGHNKELGDKRDD